MTDEKILLVLSDPALGQLLEKGILNPAGFKVTQVHKQRQAEKKCREEPPDLVILNDVLEQGDGMELATYLLPRFPQLPLLLIPKNHSDELQIRALRLGFRDYLPPPIRANDLVQSVRNALEHRRQLEAWARLKARRDTQMLKQRIDDLQALERVGRQVTSLLDLDQVLAAVIDAAVTLTGAEEGSLLLLDEPSGELYMRASRNFQDEFVHTFRLPIHDSLAGQVLRTGKPLLINEQTPHKIKTSYLVHTLIYVPLILQERVIGVMEVDNRQSGHPFSEVHTSLLSALADYASIAIENARLYSRTEIERNKLETILTKIQEGVIVVDHDGRLVLVNRIARQNFYLQEDQLEGKRVLDVFQHADLVEILSENRQVEPSSTELTLDDGRVLNAQITPIPEVGLAVTMQDITHLKELDRIKSDFVNTVSHDLRSPLTAILGYVELLERVGPINEQQKDFVRRVQISVHNITSLINDLLDLGRIEAGFDARNEIVPLGAIIQYSIDGLAGRLADKSQKMDTSIPEELPEVLGNPVRLRQMFSNILGNANKYTQPGGTIRASARVEGVQVIVQISDNGPGIPQADQPYIFDKFYRASNIQLDTPGTGLGLAIVKSIVENHQGRIWVDSTVGQGSTFTIVLPTINKDL